MSAALEVLATGPLTTVQDLGRPGLADLGVGPSGAADRGALRLANRLLGNPEGAAALEVTAGGLLLRALSPVTVAVAGAPCAAPGRGRPLPAGTVVELAPGQLAGLGQPPAGLRTYVAVRGGLAVAAVLGSCATDLLAGLGPPPVRAGDRLAVGAVPADPPPLDLAALAPAPAGEVVLRVVLGPRDDWFDSASRLALTTSRYVVTARSDRSGLRLDGPRLERAVGGELPSEGMVRGALQVPPDGRPVLLLADHPVTGGYPVVAVVVDADLDAAGQLRPGQPVRFALR